jgi:hypothetical protein
MCVVSFSSIGKTGDLTYDHVLLHLQDTPGVHTLTSAKCLFHDYISVKKNAIFCTSDDCAYTHYDKYYINHDYLDHGYIIG